MKKIIAILLSFIFVISLCGCSIEKEKNNKDSVDIEHFVGLGQIPESEYALGQDIEALKNILKQEYDTNEEAVYYFEEGNSYSIIDDGSYNYFYKNDKKEKGVSYIVSYGTAFGFPMGTVSLEIKEELENYKPTEEAITEDNCFFLFGESNGTVLKYEFKDKTLMFVFIDNGLCATALYNNSDWK